MDAEAGGPPAAHPAAVAEALQRLETVVGLPLDEHPVAYQDIHQLLQRALAHIDGA